MCDNNNLTPNMDDKAVISINDVDEIGELKEGDTIKGTGIFEGLTFEVVDVEDKHDE